MATLAGCLSVFVTTIAKAQTAQKDLALNAAPEVHSSVSGTEALPDAPEAVQGSGTDPQSSSSAGVQGSQGTGPNQTGPKQTKRILGIVPNFRAVSADTKLPPESPKEKFKTAFLDSFDYSAFIFVGVQAGISQATKAYPEFHQGAAGFGRYYWHTFADSTDENILVEGILPAVLRQDNRYYTLGHGNLLKRTAYSFTRTLITRTDGGGETFNASEIVGAGAAAGISSAYYPGQYRTWTKTGQRWLTSVLIDGGTFVVKEFWPDINSAVFHQKSE